LVNLLTETRSTETSLTRLHAEAAAVIIVEHLRWGAGRGRPSKQSLVLPRRELALVLEYMDVHLENDLSVVTLANIAGLSASHFNRCFKATTGLTPHSYLLRRRVERAKRLLATENSIADVALACGFVGQAHLTTVFHKVTGATPRAYRRSLVRS